jgi:hypothetical protein
MDAAEKVAVPQFLSTHPTVSFCLPTRESLTFVLLCILIHEDRIPVGLKT